MYFRGTVYLQSLLKMNKISSVCDMLSFLHGIFIHRVCLPLDISWIKSFGALLVAIVGHGVRLNFCIKQRSIPHLDISNLYVPYHEMQGIIPQRITVHCCRVAYIIHILFLFFCLRVHIVLAIEWQSITSICTFINRNILETTKSLSTER